jgi:predicted HAD superfamily Cof-like phosphohydrolase
MLSMVHFIQKNQQRITQMTKLQPTGNPFLDQYNFMNACDQSTGELNKEQYQLYCNLIREEFDELCESDNIVDDLDALIDILVVTIGAIHSLGANGEAAWNEVMRTNFAKIDPATGKVRKREDGKVLKPEGWTPPDLEPFVRMP